MTTTPNPDNIPEDVKKLQADTAELQKDHTALYADAESALAAEQTEATELAGAQAEEASLEAEVTHLEGELEQVAPVFTDSAAPNGTVGDAYDFMFTASGTPAPTFVATGLPAGLTLSGAGVLSGTPSAAGSSSVVVTASNTAGTVTADLTITVAAATVTTPPPVTTSTAPTVPAPSSTLPTTAVGMPAVVLNGQDWGVIHYLPNPTVTLFGTPSAINQSGGSQVAIGATGWIAVDISGQQVGSGSLQPTAQSFTPVTNGTWEGGTTVVPGWHLITCTNNGAAVAVGTVELCAAGSPLYVPSSTIDGYNGQQGLSAWAGTAANRDFYQIPEYTPAQIVANLKADPYFTGPQDPARPHKVWISSSAQSSTQPTTAQWAEVASALVAAGYTGAYYEGPTNEFENAGMSVTQMVTAWNAMAEAILAIDPTAHIIGPCSGGIQNDTPLSEMPTILAGLKRLAGFTNHMENSHQNLADLTLLDQNYSAFVNGPSYWNTETGIEGGQYGCLQPRREARQRTLLRFVAEQYGWPKEQQYDFEVFDHHGSGLTMYQVDQNNDNSSGNLRAGIYAVHVMSDALHGCPATPTKLSFGTLGDNLFAGSHYTSSARDVVVLATNGIPSAVVTLNVSATGTVTMWDGMGRPSTLEVTNGEIQVPVDDLLAYVFLPSGSTVSVVDTDQHAVTLGSATVLASTGSWSANSSGLSGATSPTSTSVPATLSLTVPVGATLEGIVLKTSGPPWQSVGCGITAMTVSVGGKRVATFADPSAVSVAVPSASNGNSSDPCTRTSFWRQTFAYLLALPEPITGGGTVTIDVTGTGYGGQPDQAAATNTTSAYNEGGSMGFQLAYFAALGTPAA